MHLYFVVLHNDKREPNSQSQLILAYTTTFPRNHEPVDSGAVVFVQLSAILSALNTKKAKAQGDALNCRICSLCEEL